MSELSLLRECVSNQTETSDGVVRFIYVDENTVYRFENNKMKKVSKSLINKALSTNNKADKTIKSNKTVKKTNKIPKRVVVAESEDSDDADELVDETVDIKTNGNNELNDDDNANDEEDIVVVRPSKQQKRERVKQKKNVAAVNSMFNEPTASIEEFYQNKYRMEYMNKELEHLTNKVNKLKQYKRIVNKLAGNEWNEQTEAEYNGQIGQQRLTGATTTTTQPQRNDSLFMF